MAARRRKKEGAETEGLLELYRSMALIRAFEEEVRVLAAAGMVPGLAHLSAGQEATAVGVCAALEPDDWIASSHRGHGHCLAKGARPDLLMAEILGRAGGYCGGRSGTLHVSDPATCNLGTNGIVGGGIPLATGAAMTERNKGSKRVAACFFGDGALNQGIVFEVMNMAAIWSLPVIYVCENNGYGEYTAIEDVAAGKLVGRGEVFEIPSVMLDGMDVVTVREATREAVERARAGGGPAFLIFNTYRYGGHHVGDKQDYKSREEVEAWKAKDPLLKAEKRMVEAGIASAAALAAVKAEVAAEVGRAVAFAKASPEPSPGDLRVHLHG